MYPQLGAEEVSKLETPMGIGKNNPNKSLPCPAKGQKKKKNSQEDRKLSTTLLQPNTLGKTVAPALPTQAQKGKWNSDCCPEQPGRSVPVHLSGGIRKG